MTIYILNDLKEHTLWGGVCVVGRPNSVFHRGYLRALSRRCGPGALALALVHVNHRRRSPIRLRRSLSIMHHRSACPWKLPAISPPN